MSHGYYDPRTPGHCPLNEHEFSKACTGVLSGYVAAWCNYIGVGSIKRILFRVHNQPQLWDKAEGLAFDTAVGGDPWSIEELHKVCESTLMGMCNCWAGFIGVDEVRKQLLYMIDEHDWDERARTVDAVVARFIELDRTQGVD